MQDQSLTDCLLLLRSKSQSEGSSIQLQQTIHHLEARLQHLHHHNTSLQLALTLQANQLKQATKRLKKTSSKLNKKEQECEELREELTRVNGKHTQKMEKLVSQSEGWKEKESWHQQQLKEIRKKNKQTASGVQCQILNQGSIKELSAQNKILKERLEQTQEMLLEEKKQREALVLRVEELTVLSEGLESELFKDNSTLDADSAKGDPFQFDEDLEGGEMMKMQEVEKNEGWLSTIVVSTQKLFRRFTMRK